MKQVQLDQPNETQIRPWIRALLIIPAYLFFVGFFQFIGYLILGLSVTELHPVKTTAQETIISLFTLTGTYLLIQIFIKNIDNQNFYSVGFYTRKFLKDIITGTILGAILLFIGFTGLILINKIQWVETKFEPSNFFFSLFLFTSVAISEELLMRGYILNNLSKSMPKVIALIVSSVTFSLMHVLNANFSWISFWNILLAGVLLGEAYIYTQNLWFPIALHFSWNFFQGTIFGFNVSGHEIYSLVKQSRIDNNIWNGGEFGFEGSILCVILQLITISGFWLFFHQKRTTTTK